MTLFGIKFAYESPQCITTKAKWRFIMNIDKIILGFAGSLILVSVILAWLVSPYWLILTTFVGINLLQSSLTGFCPAAVILKKVGFRSGNAF